MTYAYVLLGALALAVAMFGALAVADALTDYRRRAVAILRHYGARSGR